MVVVVVAVMMDEEEKRGAEVNRVEVRISIPARRPDVPSWTFWLESDRGKMTTSMARETVFEI